VVSTLILRHRLARQMHHVDKSADGQPAGSASCTAGLQGEQSAGIELRPRARPRRATTIKVAHPHESHLSARRLKGMQLVKMARWWD